jgi:hypothetical protein
VQEGISRKNSEMDYQMDIPASLYKKVKTSEEYIPKADDEDKVAEMVTVTSEV